MVFNTKDYKIPNNYVNLSPAEALKKICNFYYLHRTHCPIKGYCETELIAIADLHKILEQREGDIEDMEGKNYNEIINSPSSQLKNINK
jgi:hypothetical protein